ncbi:MAG: hypothetical protein HXX12_13030 [Geothrix sp.]|uniref:hypothetical protein n=1 Tax=Geothrix sp. TaxID=1962974 RepID=UPI0017C35782|nr:hypothetical protein [Geothrix sp.]NWJ41880.1 hypothetical protein [Geothrix sp.]WIL20147.1 MAG: hypothetical protein QOZ81_002693 [Geothrix sp.]
MTSLPISRCLLTLSFCVGMISFSRAAEVKTFPGSGSAPVAKSVFSQAKENQSGLDRAEGAALVDATRTAILSLVGTNHLEAAALEALAKDLADHSAGFLVDRVDIVESRVTDGVAKVGLTIKVNLSAMQDYLKSKGISLTKGLGNKFSLYVLAYTVEGKDPDRDKPQLLREEIRDNRQNVVSSRYAKAQATDSSRSQSQSLQASAESKDTGAVAVQSSTSVKESNKVDASAVARGESSLKANRGDSGFSGSQSGSAEARLKQESKFEGNASQSGAANWDKRSSAAVDARQASASHDARSSSASGANYSDTSTQYYRLTEYADATKKGAGSTNDVRAKFEGAFTRAGLPVKTLNFPLMAKDFRNEDEFIDHILTQAKKQKGVKSGDYVAMAINSLTPSDVDRHRFSSKITFRVVRINDGHNLLPADSVAKTSEARPSDDEARLQATELALLSMDDLLPKWVRQGLQNLKDESEVASQSRQYRVELSGVKERRQVARIRETFKKAGFKVSSETLGDGTLEVLTLELGARAPEDVKDLLDELDGTVLISKDDSIARLKLQ